MSMMPINDDELTDAELDREMDLALNTVEKAVDRLKRKEVMPINIAWALLAYAIWEIAADMGLKEVAPLIIEMTNERITQISGMGIDREVPSKSPLARHLVPPMSTRPFPL
jgi:hypothetical protein